MIFKVEFLDRDLPPKAFVADSLEHLKKMYMSGELDGNTVNHGTPEKPEAVRITEVLL